MVDGEGRMVPVTLLQIDGQKVTKVCTKEREGYSAYQVGYYQKEERKLTKPDVARLRKVDVKESYSRFREVRLDGAAPEDFKVGRALMAEDLEGVTAVDVTGLTKGRGFTGVIKRWNSARGRMTHGSQYHRRTGSIGSNTSPGRVIKNKKMPGHYGVERVTMLNLKVMDLDKNNNVIAIKGSVPGHENSYLVLRPSIKA